MPIRDRRAARTAAIVAATALAVAIAGAGCATNPDPRNRSTLHAVTDGRGGWMVLTLKTQQRFEGELIEIERGAIRLLGRDGVVTIQAAEVASGELWEWDPEIGGTGVWGVLGTASTLSHGYFLVFSAPIWIGVSSVIMAVESRAPRLEYPDHGWSDFVRWARFPQGMPPELYGNDLIHQVRKPPPPPSAAQPAPPADQPAPPADQPSPSPSPSPPAAQPSPPADPRSPMPPAAPSPPPAARPSPPAAPGP